MAKTQKILGVVLFFWLIIAIAPAYSEEGVKDKLFLKSGRVIECDKLWIPEKDIVRCKKGRGMLLYSIDDVDLKRTFGEAFGEFPITTGEEESRAKEEIPASISARKTASLKIGLEYSNFNYEEPGLMELDGTMYGIMGNYVHQSEHGLKFSLSLGYVSGSDLDYTGGTWGGTPVTAKADDYIVELRALLGVKTFFAGIGYRYWNDKVEATGGYERETLYWYVPIGIEVGSPLSEKWAWGIKAEYDLFLLGRVCSHLSEAVAGFNDSEVDQDSGYGLRFSLEFKRELRNLYALSIEPFFIYWDIDESDWAILTQYGVPIGYVYEPENETTNYGIRVNFYF